MTNSKFQELLNKLQSLKLTQTGYWKGDIPDYLYNKYFTECEVVAHSIDLDRHRWYEISTTVVRIQGGFLGIRGVSMTWGDMDFSDVGFEYEFLEMKEQVTTTYVPI